MNRLDWFVVSQLGCGAYLRYVDDFALFSDSKGELWQWKQEIVRFMAQMRLTIHAECAQVQPASAGAPWLGFVVFPAHRRLKRRNAVHFGRRLALMLDLYQGRKISFAELDAAVQGWINHVRYGDTWGLRTSIFRSGIPRPKPFL
jgi:RNA-directed DNA polymerase